MRIIRLNPLNYARGEIEAIALVLRRGGVIVYPADTVYGLGCLATDQGAIRKIFRMKKRPAGNPLLVLVSSLAMLKRYAIVTRAQERRLKRFWPGPVTVIFESRGRLPAELTAGRPSLAARRPRSRFLTALIRRIKVPLVSTSFNLSGGPVLDPGQTAGIFKRNRPDLIVDGGPLRGQPSKIIDLRDPEKIAVVRR